MLFDKGLFANAARYFASQGFGSVSINYRLSPGVSHPAHIEDTARAFAWIHENIQSHGGNPDQIFVVGYSAGAYLAALLATDGKYLAEHDLSPKNIRGVVPISGFFYVDSEGVAPDRDKSIWGTNENVWVEASPAQYISAEAPPTLILYAGGDDAWRKEQNREIASALRQVGHTNTVIQEVANRNHSSIFTGMGGSTDETTRTLLNFVMSNLQSQ